MKFTPENRFKHRVNFKYIGLLVVGLTLCVGIVLSSPIPAFSQSGTTITSGSGGDRGGVAIARLNAFAQQINIRLTRIETCNKAGLTYDPNAPLADGDGCVAGNNPCGDSGMLFGPNHPRADADGCIPDFQVADDGRTAFTELSTHEEGLQLGEPTTCDSTTEGTLRYNTAEQEPQVCNGTDWVGISVLLPQCSAFGEAVQGGLCVETGPNALIAAPNNSGAPAWGSSGTSRGTTSTTDGQGHTALLASLGASAHPAADTCANLTLDGFNDWYLPAIDEVALISGLPGLSLWYWSSTESNSSQAWYYIPSSGARQATGGSVHGRGVISAPSTV